MTQEEKVLNAFKEVGYKPRDLQVQAVIDILDAWESGKRYVFLDAPTGSGKSIIALVARQALGQKAVIITATNALAEQYERDNVNLPLLINREDRSDEFGKGLLLVMGAGQYDCAVRKEIFKIEAKADSCYKKSRVFYKQFLLEPEKCGSCKFSNTRKLKTMVDVAVTNYPYFIIDQLYIKPMAGPHGEKYHPSAWDVPLGIYDEAHLINEQFSQHYVIHYSVARSKEFIYDIRKLCDLDSNMESAYSSVFNIINENIERGSIGLSNHMTFVNMLEKFYLKMVDICETKKNFSRVETSYDMLGALQHKYHSLFCKIDDYKKYKYECVVDVNKAQGTMSIQPVFIGEASQHLLQPLNLFMSATMNYDFMIKTMALDPELCASVKVGYSFEKDDKVINFTMAREPINFGNMYSDRIIYQMREDIEGILSSHSNENGVVITTSFKMAEELALSYSATHMVMIHRSSEPAKEVIMRFKESKVPTILFSPSLFEGVDFPGDISSFQIMPKAPYLSLGSKRMHHISRKYRTIYLQMSIKRMIQGFGRSTRHAGDKSTTYVLDRNAQKLFTSPLNPWKSQFQAIIPEVDFDRSKPRKQMIKHCKGTLLEPKENYVRWAYWHGVDSGGWHSHPKAKE